VNDPKVCHAFQYTYYRLIAVSKTKILQIWIKITGWKTAKRFDRIDCANTIEYMCNDKLRPTRLKILQIDSDFQSAL
jgi:hypothetical protein